MTSKIMPFAMSERDLEYLKLQAHNRNVFLCKAVIF